jgi:hypothetical protein
MKFKSEIGTIVYCKENSYQKEFDNGGFYYNKVKSKIQYYNGYIVHKENGPAVISREGSVHWYLNGNLHREDGPAIVQFDGTRRWYINGKPHRTDGPAIIWQNGIKNWYLNGKQYTEKQYSKLIKKEMK